MPLPSPPLSRSLRVTTTPAPAAEPALATKASKCAPLCVHALRLRRCQSAHTQSVRQFLRPFLQRGTKEKYKKEGAEEV